MTPDPATHARRARPQHKPAWTWLLPASMVAVALFIPVLVWYAADAILNSTDGQVKSQIDDPTAPGYEVLVVPSPSHMVMTLDPDGALASVTVMSVASNDAGGTALFIPAETLVAERDRRLLDVFASDGQAATRRAVADLMDVNVDGLTVLDAGAWQQIVGPAGPISVDSPTELLQASGEVVFAAGNIAIDADQAATFLGWRNAEEGSQGRIQRQVAFWRAWVDTIAAGDETALIPGEITSGFPRMLNALSSGQAVLTSVAGTDVTLEDGSLATQVDIAELRSLVNAMIPFPRPVVPGARPRVRLLDGVGGLDVASQYSAGLVGSGAQIVIIGNASTIPVAETVVIFHDQRFEPQAQAFSDVLGGAVVQFEPVADAVLDVTVIIGQDQEAALS